MSLLSQVSSIFSPPLPFCLILVSLATQTLSFLFLTLSLFDLGLAPPNAEMVAQQGMVAFCVGTSCRNSWVLVVWFQWVSPVSFSSLFFFHRLAFFHFFFHPKRKTLRFWVWVWAKIKRDEDGRNNDCRERMAGAWVCGGVVSVGLWACGGWPVGAWWWLVVGLWRWGAVGLGLWRWGCSVGLLQTKEKKIEEKKK